jgi:hypothetical protein
MTTASVHRSCHCEHSAAIINNQVQSPLIPDPSLAGSHSSDTDLGRKKYLTPSLCLTQAQIKSLAGIIERL